MLERTGKDVGSARKLYVDAQAFVFCSAALSRKTMEADAANAALCPYSIMVYETVAEPGKVTVSYRRPWRPEARRLPSPRWPRSTSCWTALRARRSACAEPRYGRM